MSSDRSAVPSTDLAGEASGSSSQGLRQDTRTSNSERCDNQPPSNAAERKVAKGGVTGELSPPFSPHVGIVICLTCYYVTQHTQLVQKIKQLEQETAGPERRQAAKVRTAFLKEIQQHLAAPGNSAQEKIQYMEGVFAKQVWHPDAASALSETLD